MSEKKQTALQWLIENIENYKDPDAIKKALQMEREQIEEAYKDGYCDRHSDEITINSENNRI